MKVLITGGAGYLGTTIAKFCMAWPCQTFIVDSLLHNQGPFVYDLFNNDLCKFYKSDIQDIPQKLLAKVDVIFHLAAWVGAPLCDTNPPEAKRVNTKATSWLISKLSPRQRIIFPCSNSGYGNAGDVICDEKTPFNSISLYGQTKEEAEKIVLEHPKATSFRLATVFGPSIRNRIDLLVNYLTYQAYHNKEIEIFEGDLKRNYINILDVRDILFDAIFNRKTHGQIYNLGLDEANMSKLQLMKKIIEYFPNRKIIINNKKKDPDQRNYFVSSNKLKTQAKMDLKYNLEDGIKSLIKFYDLLPSKHNQQHKTLIRLMSNV